MGDTTQLRTILLVDDRDDCRITTKWFLTNFGYSVDAARSAEEALEVFDPRLHNVVVKRRATDLDELRSLVAADEE